MGLRSFRCTYATGLGTVALIIAACQPTGDFVQKPSASAITFPYLDGTETKALPKYRQLAHGISSSYVKLTLLAPSASGDSGTSGDLHTGSGIILDSKGHILTAAHIARGMKYRLRVELRSGQRFIARVIRIDPRKELALLRAPPMPGLQPVSFAPDRPPAKGDPVLGIGSPKRTWGVATLGIVRSPNIRERLDYGPWGFANAIEISMLVQSGHSGGPVIDAAGRLVGMIASYELGDTTKWPYRSPRITYVVPVADIRRWLAR